MPPILQWTADAPQGLAQALEQLRAGNIVGFPSDAGYLLACNALSLDQLQTMRFLAPAEPLALTLAYPIQVFDWLPRLRGAGLRMARRFWPGFLVLLSDIGLDQGACRWLPREVCDLLSNDGALALTVPNHVLIRQAAYHLALPLAVTAFAEPVRTAEDLAGRVGEQAALILDGGPLSEARPTTLVRLRGKKAEVPREGGISAVEVAEASACRIVFICTGNTCRSPMAQALCARMLADWLGCPVEELPRRGYIVQSAGLAALAGDEASPEGVEAVRGHGADLSRHRSQPLSYELLAQADFVFCMTRSHLRMLHELRVEAGPEPRLISLVGEDVADPIGGPPQVYQECAGQIRACLEQLLPELQENG